MDSVAYCPYIKQKLHNELQLNSLWGENNVAIPDYSHALPKGSVFPSYSQCRCLGTQEGRSITRLRNRLVQNLRPVLS